MKQASDTVIMAFKELRDSLPSGNRVVVLIFDDDANEALLVSQDPYPLALERVREWVKAQEADQKEVFSA